MNGPETAPPLEFRDMAESDLADGLRLSRAAGWNQTAEDWRLLLSLGPGLFRVAAEPRRVVATGGAVRYGRDLAWICMILVDPERRGRGLGTRIFDEVLERAKAAVAQGGLRAVGLDATPAGRRIYVHCGFQDADGIVRMRAEGPRLESRLPVPDGAHESAREIEIRDRSATVRPLAASDLDSVLARDLQVFGADRGAVLRWAATSAPDLAWIATGTTTPAYCFGRHGDHSDHVGPVVADDPAQAGELVRACRAGPGSRPLVVDARVEPSWIARLAALGFREQRPFTRMYLGDARPSARPAVERAVFGPEFA